MNKYIKKFKEISIADTAIVGGKNSSLGEMFTKLSSKGIPVPDGFVVTTISFDRLIQKYSLDDAIRKIIESTNVDDTPK